MGRSGPTPCMHEVEGGMLGAELVEEDIRRKALLAGGGEGVADRRGYDSAGASLAGDVGRRQAGEQRLASPICHWQAGELAHSLSSCIAYMWRSR